MTTYVVVTHSHLDREWYRTAEQFRARLIDAVDAVLDHIARDPHFVFTLDGQTVVLEDYLDGRPFRFEEVVGAVQRRQLVIGPWYVQADGFIPAGESIVRNLLEGKAVGASFGPMSEVAYLPDTFGHPASLPLILAGAGLTSFCHGRGTTRADGPTEYRWEGPDGSAVLGIFLPGGYHNAANLPGDVDAAAAVLAASGAKLAARSTGETILFMAGHDHVVPADLSPVLARLAATTGAEVARGSVDDVAAAYLESLHFLEGFSGEIRMGAPRVMLEGVWSTRSPLKLANAASEARLYGLAEPFAAIAFAFGAEDERPSLRVARRELLKNQAHDSLCGTSIDAVHREMLVRFEHVDDIADTVAERALGELAGSGPFRSATWDGGTDLAVFNPHPHPVSGMVRWWFDADPPYAVDSTGVTLPPLLLAAVNADGFEIDGEPVRLMTRPNERMFSWDPDQDDRGIEFVVRDLPPMGWKKYRLTSSAAHDDKVDDGRV